MPEVYVTENTGCTYFHPFTCGKNVIAPCPQNCQRKAAFDEYHEVGAYSEKVFGKPREQANDSNKRAL